MAHAVHTPGADVRGQWVPRHATDCRVRRPAPTASSTPKLPEYSTGLGQGLENLGSLLIRLNESKRASREAEARIRALREQTAALRALREMEARSTSATADMAAWHWEADSILAEAGVGPVGCEGTEHPVLCLSGKAALIGRIAEARRLEGELKWRLSWAESTLEENRVQADPCEEEPADVSLLDCLRARNLAVGRSFAAVRLLAHVDSVLEEFGRERSSCADIDPTKCLRNAIAALAEEAAPSTMPEP